MKKVLPNKVPHMAWIYKKLARLAGWKDGTLIGRLLLKCYSKSYFNFTPALETYELARFINHDF